MWLSRLLVAAFLVTLAACADMKVQSLGTSLAGQDIRISVVEAGGREGQIYSRALRDRLMNSGADLETHSLSTSISSSSTSTLSVSGQSSQLKKMTMSANINLVDLQSGETVFSGTVSANATLGTVSSIFANDRSDRLGRERLAKLLAERVAARIHLHFLDNGA